MTLKELLQAGSDPVRFRAETKRQNEENRKDPSLLVNFLKKIGQIKD